ncbi:hypothetical protein K1X76_12930 [bacterium]|nr:hypothetical protein [bacterium]
MKNYIMILICCVILHNCAAALVGGAFYKSSKTKEQRQEFMTSFQKTNSERQAAGFKPLDWCSEVYKFDPGWANNDPQCNARIKAYEKGDKNALSIEN